MVAVAYLGLLVGLNGRLLFHRSATVFQIRAAIRPVSFAAIIICMVIFHLFIYIVSLNFLFFYIWLLFIFVLKKLATTFCSLYSAWSIVRMEHLSNFDNFDVVAQLFNGEPAARMAVLLIGFDVIKETNAFPHKLID